MVGLPSNFDHFEIFLARAAFRTRPVRRHVFPAGAGGYALVGRPFGLVVDPAADEAHVFLQFGFRSVVATIGLEACPGVFVRSLHTAAIIIGNGVQHARKQRGHGQDMIKINFGSGPYPIAGWINVDLDPAGRPQVVADLGRALPFATGVADFIHTEDFIAQLDPMPLLSFLRECRRILKPDGAMRVLTPDLERFARTYLEDPDHLVWIWNTFVGVPLETGTACEVLNLGMRLAGRFQYDFVTFSGLAAKAGFETVRVGYNESRFEALRGVDLRRTDEAISMYVECTPSH
jgi:hypothetical protein